MVLYSDGIKKIRRALVLVSEGKPSPYVKIGTFSPADLEVVNAMREKTGLPPLSETIVFNGKHVFNSRCTENGYSIDEVVEHIEIAFSRATDLQTDHKGWGTIFVSPSLRVDCYGKNVRDELVFECTGKYPSASLFSAIPRGDGRLER